MHLHDRLYEIWQGVDVAPEQAELYRNLWLDLAKRKPEDVPRDLRPKKDKFGSHFERLANGELGWLCIHRGQRTGDSGACTICGRGQVQVDVYRCGLKGQCTPQVVGELGRMGIQNCGHCADRVLPTIKPLREVDVDGGRIQAGISFFNCSIIEDKGKLLLAARAFWNGAELVIGELGEDLQPVADSFVHLEIPASAACRDGREDPRLFHFGGRVHVSFDGVFCHPDALGGGMDVHMLVARLDEEARKVEEVWEPQYAGRRAWEKNWTFFEHEGRLFSVYAITGDPLTNANARHTVLAHDPPRAWIAFNEPWRCRWSRGIMRGGASPVRVGDEYWHFFHSFIHNTEYTLGLYAFEARPPFRPTRIVTRPIYVVEKQDVPGEVPCFFAGGAVKRGARWLVAGGVVNRICRVLEFEHRALDRLLVPV